MGADMATLTIVVPLLAVGTLIVGVLAVRNAVHVNQQKHAAGGHVHREGAKPAYS
jgi:hypothetical protein